VRFFLGPNVSREPVENVERRCRTQHTRQGAAAARIKVRRFVHDGRGCFDVRTQVPDAVGAAEAAQGSYIQRRI